MSSSSSAKATASNSGATTLSESSSRSKSKVVVFDEEMRPQIDPENAFEPAPASHARTPYWLLRRLRHVIENGGFVCTVVYVPRLVWKQSGVKFSGLSVKTAAFEQIVALIERYIEPLCFPDAEEDQVESLKHVLTACRSFAADAMGVQNMLSKPFPYIREVAEVAAAPAAPAASSQGQVARWTSLVADIGKSMVKYAEVGYQRLGAMTVKISDEEFEAFGLLATVLCEKIQIFDRWIDYLERERVKAVTNTRGIAERRSSRAADISPLIDVLEVIRTTHLHPSSLLLLSLLSSS